MTDRPIIFSGPMVRALLDGRKTQTRRILKPQPDTKNGGTIWSGTPFGPLSYNGTWPDGTRSIQSVPYAPGDRLYVREAHYLTDDSDEECVVYAEDQNAVDLHLASIQTVKTHLNLSTEWAKPHIKLRPSIHMHRWASRITLTVTEVRVQRLQGISEADARAEGIEPYTGPKSVPEGEFAYRDYYEHAAPGWWLHPRGSFGSLWNSLHGPDAWDANPWVAAISFTVREGNIDDGQT